MPYWEMVARSFAISWRHRYLWLLAVFSGEVSGGGLNSGTPSFGRPNFTNPSNINYNNFQRQVSDWLNQHIALLLTLGGLLILLAILFFVLAAVCEGALVRGSAEHDAERPFSLGTAWRCGVAAMGVIIRFRLLIIALALPAVVVGLALFVGFIVALVGGSAVGAVAFGLVLALFFLASLVYTIYLGFLDRLGTRAVVLEQIGARAALVRGHRLLVKRLGRVLLVWLLSIAVGIVVGICTGIVLAIVLLPVVGAAIAAFISGSAVAWVLVAVGGVILLPIALTIQGFVTTQSSTYWTLAFRRLEIDQAPAYSYPSPQPSPPPAMA